QTARRAHQTPHTRTREDPRTVSEPRPVGERRHHHVRLADAERVQRARVRVIEAVPVVARVEERERPARGGRRHVDAQNVLERDGEQVPPRRRRRLVLPQLVLGGEWQAAHVVERLQPRSPPELATIERAVGPGMRQLFAQPRDLEPSHGGARGALEPRLEIAGDHYVSWSISDILPKNLSAIIFATPPSMRCPTEAMRPPTCTSAL